MRINCRRVVSCLLMVLSSASFAETAVVVATSSPLSSVTKEDLAQLYQGESKALGGNPAIPSDQSKTAPIRESFYQAVAGKSSNQAMAVWTKIVFSGKGKAPQEFPSDAEVKNFVNANPGGIGYINAAAADQSVKVVLKLP